MKFLNNLKLVWFVIFFMTFVGIGIYDFSANSSVSSLIGALVFFAMLLFFLIVYRNGGLTHKTYFILGASLIFLSVMSAYSIVSKNQSISFTILFLYLIHLVIFAVGILMIIKKLRPVIIYIRKNDRIRDYALIVLITLGTIHLILNWNF